jgi:aryl-phospho-beta-D-glucosidase BglC (GH1 family)
MILIFLPLALCSRPAVEPRRAREFKAVAATNVDWFSAKGNKIVDSAGNEVWLTGCNWFGYNTGTNIFDGIWSSNLADTVEAVADRGFNLFRVPFSVQIILEWKKGTYATMNMNPYLNEELRDKNSLECWDFFLDRCREHGIKVMIDFHSAPSASSGHQYALWTAGGYTVDDFYAAHAWIVDRYKKDDVIIAIDLKNEPHGKKDDEAFAKWDDSKDANNWKNVAQTAAQKILAINPNLLIMVEGVEIFTKDLENNADYHLQATIWETMTTNYWGTWWGGNLRGAAYFPLKGFENKLVYSPHDYGPTVYEQEWFKKEFTYDTLMEDVWHDNWFYLWEKETAPLLIGEWGGFLTNAANKKWLTAIRKLIIDKRLSHTFWCLNPNSGDTGGLLADDYIAWDEEKYAFVKEALWTMKDGKFIGLSSSVPLGKNGVTRQK